MLRDQQPRYRLPNFRQAVEKIDRDLLSIEKRARRHAGYYPNKLTNLEVMTLILEDRRFFRHNGFDFFALCRESFKLILGRKHGGASTIDMQFVRTATGYREYTFRRKAYEVLISILIQFKYSKIEILRSYLDCAYFGWRLRGSESAAKKMFNCSSKDLSIEQAAYIASLLVYPRPSRPPSCWQSRVDRRSSVPPVTNR